MTIALPAPQTATQSKAGVTAKVEMISPEKAAEYLTRNKRNRTIRPPHVAKLANMMGDGNFFFTGANTIVFSDDGDLLDGQHRLSAQVKSGVTLPAVVVRGISPDAQFFMDTHAAPRSLAESLVMLDLADKKEAPQLASLTQMAYRFDVLNFEGKAIVSLSSKDKVTTIALLDYFDSNQTELRAAAEKFRIEKVAHITGRFAAFASLLFSRIDKTDSDFFFEKLASGADLAADSPILLLRNKLAQNKLDKANGNTFTTVTEMALVIKAWNLFRQGTTVKSLQFRPGGTKPEAFPEAV